MSKIEEITQKRKIAHKKLLDLNSKTYQAFLELDPRINAEIFCEYRISSNLSLILNMECSSVLVSEEASSWFSRVRAGISANII